MRTLQGSSQLLVLTSEAGPGLERPLGETELPVCLPGPRPDRGLMGLSVGLTGALRSASQKRGERRGGRSQGPGRSPHWEGPTCPHCFYSGAQDLGAGIPFAPISFFDRQGGRQRWAGSVSHSPLTSLPASAPSLFGGTRGWGCGRGAFSPFKTCFWVLLQYTHSCPQQPGILSVEVNFTGTGEFGGRSSHCGANSSTQVRSDLPSSLWPLTGACSQVTCSPSL